MTRLLLALLVSAVPTAVSAQRAQDHAQHAPQAEDSHRGHAMPSASVREEASVDPHKGHVPHTELAPGPAPPPPEALQGPDHAADGFWGQQAMERARQDLLGEHGDLPVHKVLVDQFEARFREGTDGYFLNAETWYGGDIDKFWLKGEAEGEFDREPERVEIQALWSHAISPWFDLQAGVRYDVLPGPDRGRLVLGVQGLAPYWIQIDAAAFLSDRGDLTARLEAEHDARITQKLVLQPRIEANFALQDIPHEQVGSGLSTADVGLRLRYQVSPLFAPYVGLEHSRAFGDTRAFRRAAGESPNDTRFLVGIRAWY